MSSRIVIAGSIGAILLAVVVVLALHGTGEDGFRAAIRATARTSALCVVFAMLRVRARAFAIVLPVSHALHYAMIVSLAVVTTFPNAHITAASAALGIVILALMVWNAATPKNALLYILWIVFVVAFLGRGYALPYVLIVLALLGSGVARFLGSRRLQLS